MPPKVAPIHQMNQRTISTYVKMPPKVGSNQMNVSRYVYHAVVSVVY